MVMAVILEERRAGSPCAAFGPIEAEADNWAALATFDEARARHPGATLADLYDPDLMPADLRRAHRDNDRTVDRLYRRAAFASEGDRVAQLLSMYEQQVAGMLAAQTQKKPRQMRKLNVAASGDAP